LTRKLGIRYLWIDAVCIFQDQERQDSKDDWALEAGRMRDVYRGAVVTIEAANATRGSEGFLKQRSDSRPYCALRWADRIASTTVYLLPVFDITDNQLLATKVYTRGWTLQERLLAPRTLSFGTQQISFECANGFVDEARRSTMLPRVTESHLSKDSMRQLRRGKSWLDTLWRSFSRMLGLPPIVTLWEQYGIGWSIHGMLNVPGGYWATYYDYWRGIVELFTERELTKRGDRLPALAGLANVFQRATGDTYVAGMWKAELLMSLAWQCSDLYDSAGEYGNYADGIPANSIVYGSWPDSVRQSVYIAPSWSWASVKGRVNFFLHTYQEDRSVHVYAKVEAVTPEPKYASHPLGSLNGGSLIITGPVLQIEDPQTPCSVDYSLKTWHDRLRKATTHIDDNTAPEFHQHHQSHDGQAFLVLKLLHENPPPGQIGKLLKMLLLESTGEGGEYRRLYCFEQQLVSPAELEMEHFGHWIVVSESDKEYKKEMQPELEEVTKRAAEVETAEWVVRTITIV